LHNIYPRNLKEILLDLDWELPPLPARPKVEQENPPPYLYPRETIGPKAPKPAGGQGSVKGAKDTKSKSPKKDKKDKKGKKDEGVEILKPKISLAFHTPPPPLSSIANLIEKDVKEIYSHSVHLNLLEDQWYTAVRPCLI
jgi:hypothetical protein